MSFLNWFKTGNKKNGPDVSQKSEVQEKSADVVQEEKEEIPVENAPPLEVYEVPAIMKVMNEQPEKYHDEIEAAQGVLSFVQNDIRSYLKLKSRYQEWKTEMEMAERRRQKDVEAAIERGETPEEEKPKETLEEEDKSQDSRVETVISKDQMFAYIYLLPPIGEGKEVTLEKVTAAVEENGIQYGIDQEIISQIAKEKPYFLLFPIARGLKPVNGKDGEIIDHFSRERKIHLQEDEKGIINYKDLNIFQSVKEGETICDIVAPTEGTNGVDVTGTIQKADAGKKPRIPNGKNTSLNEDGSILIATTNGDLSFQGNVFRVEHQLTIKENVDGSVGNINYEGDVLVKGDVCNGFTVQATGNIMVLGMVEGAKLIAGGNINIEKGMNGNGVGLLEAGGTIKTRFLEQTNLKAAQDINAETIINSNIMCGGSLYAKNGKGIIIGGTISVFGCVEAKKIGNLSNNETVINLGVSGTNEKNVENLTKELKNSKEVLDRINKNVAYMNRMPSISADKQEIYDQIKEQKREYDNKIKEIEDKLEAAENCKLDFNKCYVKGDYIFGETHIILGYSKAVIKTMTTRCYVYYADGELVIGNY